MVAYITNFMGHDLVIIVMWNVFSIGSYGIDKDVIHLLVLFEHWCRAHYLNMNVICLFILFIHRCCMFIHVIYTWKSCTWLLYLNNAWYLRLNNMKLWNNKFCTNLEQTHGACNFVMYHCINEFLLPLIYGLEKLQQLKWLYFLPSVQGGHFQESIMVFDILGWSFSPPLPLLSKISHCKPLLDRGMSNLTTEKW
jgi:hypothetical protein